MWRLRRVRGASLRTRPRMWRTEAGTGCVSPHKAADVAYRGRYGVRLSAQGRGRGVPRQVRGASLRTKPRTRRTEAGTGVRLSAQSRGRGVPRRVRGAVSPHKAKLVARTSPKMVGGLGPDERGGSAR